MNPTNSMTDQCFDCNAPLRKGEVCGCAMTTASAQQDEREALAWINYPVKLENGEFAGYGEPELSFKREAYGYDTKKAVKLVDARAAQRVQAAAGAVAIYQVQAKDGNWFDTTERHYAARVSGKFSGAARIVYAHPCPAGESSQAAHDVLAERVRQISHEGWTPEHDDQYADYEMAQAAACYIMCDEDDSLPTWWPWAPEWWKPKGIRRDLVRAGALILAEIERIDRAANTATFAAKFAANNESAQ